MWLELRHDSAVRCWDVSALYLLWHAYALKRTEHTPPSKIIHIYALIPQMVIFGDQTLGSN